MFLSQRFITLALNVTYKNKAFLKFHLETFLSVAVSKLKRPLDETGIVILNLTSRGTNNACFWSIQWPLDDWYKVSFYSVKIVCQAPIINIQKPLTKVNLYGFRIFLPRHGTLELTILSWYTFIYLQLKEKQKTV